MDSAFAKRVGCLFNVVLLAFVALLAWQGYWHLTQSGWLLRQPTNRRVARLESRVARGTIYDRDGAKLAWSTGRTRHYADPVALAAVVGYSTPVHGRSNLERGWNLELSGLSESFTAEELNRILRKEPPQGRDLTLTLDLRLQQVAQRALQGRTGAAVVLDPATGGILAAATSPTFNAETVDDDYPALLRDTRGPLQNRALQNRYPPGSTMKLVTAAAALMHGVDPEATQRCEGKSRMYGVTVTDYHGTRHGAIAMREALAKSCNHYFARTAAELDGDAFSATARAFGFGRRWWEELPTPRLLPATPAFSSLTPPGDDAMSQGERAHMGFGQSTVVASPLQMAMVAAAIANDGTLMAPYLVTEVRKPANGTHEAQVLAAHRPERIGYPLDRDTARALAAMMRDVVTRGTGGRADVRGVTVYGKTGTAQQTGGADHAWFVGFAEDDAGARIAFAVLLERGGSGGRDAGPVAQAIIRGWRELD